MKKILSILTLAFASTALAQSTSLRTSDHQQFSSGKVLRNYVKNSGAEKGLNFVTASSSPTLTRSTTNPLKGSAQFAIDATSSGQTYTWAADDFQGELVGQACAATFKYSGDASLYKAYAKLGSSVVSAEVQLLNTGSSVKSGRVEFLCGESTTDDPTFVIEATDNAAAAIVVDDIFIGESGGAFQLMQSKVIGSLSWSVTSGCDWVRSLTTYAAFATVAACDDNARTILGSVTDPAAGLLPKVGIPWQGPGWYSVNANFVMIKGSSAAGNAFFRGVDDDGNVWSGVVASGTGASSSVWSNGSVFSRYYSSRPSSGVINFSIQGRTSVATTIDAQIRLGDEPGSFVVSYSPSDSQLAYDPTREDKGGTSFSANTTNCNWSTTSGTMASFAVDSDCAVPTTTRNLSAPATKIPAAVARSLSAGSYKVDAFGGFSGSASTSGTQSCLYEIYDGTTSGGVQQLAQNVNLGISSGATLSGIFTYTGDQTNKQFEIRGRRISGNGSCSVLNETNDLVFVLTPLTQAYPAPWVLGGVYFGRTSLTKKGAAQIDCDSASTILSNPDSMVTSVGNVSTGACALNLGTYFRSINGCSVIRLNSSPTDTINYWLDLASAPTSIGVGCRDGATANCSASNFYIECTGT